MAYVDPELGRRRGRERFRQRVEARRAAGLCPRCGDRPPATGRSVCGPCCEKRNKASRARDAKLRASGKPRRGPERARRYERERSRRLIAERCAAGLCTGCGREAPEPDRRLCAGCGEKRRAAERARHAEAKARGAKYGGRDPDAKRRSAREGSRRRDRARREAGSCSRCGARPPVEGGATCEPCRLARRAAEKERYMARRAAGLCGKCGQPAFAGDSRCAVCATLEDQRDPARKNASARRRYARRRARRECTDCGGRARDAARCEDCARRSYLRSGEHRGLPALPPLYTVIEIATGECHGVYDTEAEVAGCLAFAKLSRDQVEILADTSPMSAYTSW